MVSFRMGIHNILIILKKCKHLDCKQHATEQQWVNEEIKEEIKKIPWGKCKWKHSSSISMRHRKSSSKREVYSNTQETKESQISNLTQHLKELDKGEQRLKLVG